MLKIDYSNILIEPSAAKQADILKKIQEEPEPSFETHKPDLKYIADKAKKYKKYKNIILIGNGGSRTSAWAFYFSLAAFRNKVNFEFLSSAEPELILNLRKKYTKKDTLVLIISKSGDNINAIEPLLFLIDYPILAVTGEKENTLSRIAAAKKIEIAIHPEIGGRYSGLTSCGLLPACLMGLSVEKIYAGAQNGYQNYSAKSGIEQNDALKLAVYFSELEDKDFTEIFASIYSSSLFAFLPLVIQLIHESTGKDGKGQTIFGDYSPESQHHTNQRFFGGRKNTIGLIIGVDETEKDTVLKIPKNLSDVPFKDITLKTLNELKASDTMKFDMEGVLGNCALRKIPAVKLTLNKITEENIGEFMVFWHYFAMYSALLRGQNPFDQPEVEGSKRISLELRKKHKNQRN